MEDGIERSMSFFITELEKKQRIVAMPKYEEQVHPIGLSLIGRETTPIGHDNTPIGHDNTPIVRQEACPKTGREACPNTSQETLANITPNLQSTNTGSDS